jgi:hypothetical protein
MAMKLYVPARKAYDQRHNLVKVVARLDPASLAFIKSIQAKFPLAERYDANHVVLAGSMTREKAMGTVNDILCIAIRCRRFTASQVVDFADWVNGKRCRSQGLLLAATDTRLQLALDGARQKHCVLPQWPLSLVLGSFARARKYKGAVMVLNDGRAMPTLAFDLLAVFDSSGQSILIPAGVHQQDSTIKAEVGKPAGQVVQLCQFQLSKAKIQPNQRLILDQSQRRRRTCSTVLNVRIFRIRP